MASSLPALPSNLPPVPALISEAGDHASRRFVEFFTAQIRNRNTRQAYARAVGTLLAWSEARGLTLDTIQPVHVAAFIEELGAARSVATVKQYLAGIRALFDYLVTGQVIPMNPAHAVRGPKLVRDTGATPILDASQARALLDVADPESIMGARD